MRVAAVSALALAATLVACSPPPIEGEGEGREGEGEEGEGEEGEGEGDVGEGEGDVGEGEGEGEGEGDPPAGNGTCASPFIAVRGRNTGTIATNTPNAISMSCGAGDGGEHVWRFTAPTAGAHVVAVATAEDPTIDIEAFALDSCSGGTELACQANLGDETLTVDLPAGERTVDIVVDSFLTRSTGRYALTVDVATDVGLGDTCDTFHVCSDGSLCSGGVCVDAGDAHCSAETNAGVGPLLIVPVGETRAPTCGGLGAAPLTAMALTHTMSAAGALRIENADFFGGDVVVERRNVCDGTTLTCAAISGGSDMRLPGLRQGDVVHLAVFPTQSGQSLNLVEEIELQRNARCTPNDANAVCVAGTSCLGLAGAETCTNTRSIAAGGVCNLDDSRDVCSASQCVEVGTDSRCLASQANLCTAPVALASGQAVRGAVSTISAVDPQLCGGFANGEGDRVFSYTMQNPQGRLTLTPEAGTTVGIYAGNCASATETACADGFSGTDIATADAAAGTVFTITASAPAGSLFAFAVREDPIAILNPGDVCDPTSTTATCGGGTLCLGGPSPRAFRCTTASPGADGEGCIANSSDETCALGLRCNSTTSVCGPAAAERSGTLTATLPTSPTSTDRVGNNCARFGAASNFQRFGVENPGAVTATVTFETTGGNDTVAAFYQPAFVTTSAVTQCVTSNDDINFSAGNANSRITTTLAAQTSAEVIIWPFNAGDTFTYGLTYTSDQPIIVHDPS